MDNPNAQAAGAAGRGPREEISGSLCTGAGGGAREVQGAHRDEDRSRPGRPAADFHRLKDEVFRGYMALPNVFLVFKSLELWTRDRDFLRAALPAGTFVYVEEREEPRTCVMADNFGLLANGEYVLCCLDYEAEMAIGNIDSMPVGEALGSGKRSAVRKDAMTEKVCRRCKGNVFVFDTAPISSNVQDVDRFGRGWWEFETGLSGSGGRWTKGRAWAYVYSRIAARSLACLNKKGFNCR